MKAIWLTIIFIPPLLLMSCQKQESRNTLNISRELPDSAYLKAGDRIATKTFDSLRQALLSAIGNGGFPYAIEFCSENASELTNIIADSVTVRRVASRYRNPRNKPDTIGSEVLDSWEAQMKRSEKPKMQLIRVNEDNEVRVYKPIILQSMCVNCHGIPGKNVQEDVLNKIRTLYPNDLAINFQEGDLRGAWELIFKTTATAKK